MSTYDQRAANLVAKLERAVPPRAQLDSDYTEIGALINALEVHVETGRGDAGIVRLYEQLFVAMALLRERPAKQIEKARRIFSDLIKHLSS